MENPITGKSSQRDTITYVAITEIVDD